MWDGLYSEEYNICGKKIVDKTVDKFIGEGLEPSLFIYLLQDKNEPKKLKISVSQDNGYSISEVIVSSDVLNNPITIKGKGRYWGDSVSKYFRVPEKTYEEEIFIASEKFNTPIAFHINVTYYWICKSGYDPSGFVSRRTFQNCGRTTKATLLVTNESCKTESVSVERRQGTTSSCELPVPMIAVLVVIAIIVIGMIVYSWKK